MRRTTLLLAALCFVASCKAQPSATSPPSGSDEGTAVAQPATPAATGTNALVDDSGEAPDADSTPLLEYIEITTGGAASDDSLPLLIAIHGYGDRPEGIAGVYRSLGVQARVVLPQGPLPHPRGGFSWYDIGAAEYAEQVAAAAERIVALTAHILESRPSTGTVCVSGFSQGGILSFELAARHDGVFDAAFPIAGRLADLELLRPTTAGASTRVRAFHGASDERISLADGQAAIDALRAAGWTTELTIVPALGHGINAELRAALHVALSETLALGGPTELVAE